MPDTPSRRLNGRGQASNDRRKCVYCSKEANVKGIASHERACKKKKDDLEMTLEFLTRQRNPQDEVLEAALEQTNRALADMNLNSGNDLSLNNNAEDFVHVDDNPDFNSNVPNATTPATQIVAPPIDSKTGKPIHDAIKIVYHPNSERAEEIESLFDYRSRTKVTQPVEEIPWLPFETRGDYEFSEIALAASLSAQQANALIALIHRFIRKEAEFTIANNTEMQKKWKQASKKLTEFDEREFDVQYKTEKRTFKVYYRPIWDWILDLLTDPQVVSHFRWDARKIYKYQSTSQTYVRYYDEPWTAGRFWDVQSEFKFKETKPLSIIFYADKNKLSSFGTQKGYPVIVRCANLPVSIRNSDGIGGGIILGWLPIVPENAGESGKAGYANFKASVWHRAVDIIMHSIRKKSKEGRWVKCGDGVDRHVCPHISMISADHEEQWVITLNRGSKGKKACVVCNHPTATLSNLSKDHTFRTSEDSKAYYELSKLFSTAKSREFILKLHGMRPVRNAFWKIGHTDVHRAISWDRLHAYPTMNCRNYSPQRSQENLFSNYMNAFWKIGHTDVHRAISWDRLHAYHSGLFGSHMWPVFKLYFEDLGRKVMERVDKRLNLFPRWRDLYHFDSAIKVTFNDGKKHEDLSKQLLYVIHDIFERTEGSAGYLFLRLFRKYLELDVYMSFELHTEDTISCAEEGLKDFGKLLLEYISLTEDISPKNWSFLKAHSHKHACDDIRAKGVTRNFNTKPNEKMHGPLRDIYHEQTNFRDVAPQILKVSHMNLVSTLIRSQLDVLDHNNGNSQGEGEDEDKVSEPAKANKRLRPPLLPPNDKFSLGAQQKACTLAQVEQDMKADVAFKDFRKKLIVHLNEFFNAYSVPLPNGKYLKLLSDDEIVEFRFLKVNYESLVTWEVKTDYLRCTKEFFGKPRYDYVLFDIGSKRCFARLVFLFAISIGNTAYPIALVQALDAYLGPPRLKDQELGLRRIGMKPRAATEFITVSSIIRGTLIVPVFEAERENEYFVVDLIDSDMFLRCRDLKDYRR